MSRSCDGRLDSKAYLLPCFVNRDNISYREYSVEEQRKQRQSNKQKKKYTRAARGTTSYTLGKEVPTNLYDI